MNYQLLEAIIIRIRFEEQVTCEAVGAHQREVAIVLLEGDLYVLVLSLEQGIRRILIHLFDAWGEAGSNQKREDLHYLCEVGFLHPVSHPDLLRVEWRGAIHDKLKKSNDSVLVLNQVLHGCKTVLSERCQHLEIFVKAPPVVPQYFVEHFLAEEDFHEADDRGSCHNQPLEFLLSI
jgi:hypothetical protein